MRQGKPRRIAMVGPFGLQPNQTMRSRALGLAKPLLASGHQVAIFMPPWQTPEEAGRQWLEDGVPVHYTAVRGGPAITFRALLKAVLAWRPQVVHCFKPKAYSGLVAWWLWHFHRRRLRLVTDTDDWEGWGGWNDLAPYSSIQKHIFSRQEAWGLHHCHRLTVASRALETIALSQGIAPDRVVYLPNGPGLSAGARLEPASLLAKRRELGLGQRPTLLIYSRLFEFETGRLVQILAAVRASVPALRVMFVGAGLYQEDGLRLRSQLAAADLETAVLDMGWVERDHLPPLLSVADVALYLMDDTLLNRTKCPVKLADLVSLGLPVVAEAVGQVMAYVRHNETGMLCASGDTDCLASAIITLLQNRSRGAQLGAAARRYGQANFSWSRLARIAERSYWENGSPRVP